MAKSLSEQFNDLSKPESFDFDIEDHERMDGSGSESSEEELEKPAHYVEMGKSSLRDDNIKMGSKYTGKRSSRKDLYDSGDENHSDGSEDLSEGEVSSQDEKSSGDQSDQSENPDQSDSDQSDSDQSVSDQNVSDQEIDSESDDEEKREKLKHLINKERSHIVNRLSSTAKSDALKGYAILNQNQTFEGIMDARIKLQKAMSNSNLLPVNKKSAKQFETKETGSLLEQSKSAIYDLLDTIFQLRVKLYERDAVSSDIQVKTKKRNFSAYMDQTELLDTTLESYRKSVLTKWSNKVNSASGSAALNSNKFTVINQNSASQVESNLQDMGRLVKRTKLNRRNVKPLGYVEEKSQSDNVDDEEDDQPDSIDKSLQQSQSIFDDEDFYRVLLNDLVDKKIASNQSLVSSNAVSLGKNKMHKHYDRKASKGRKLKYAVQESLLNFETPRSDKKKWGDDQIDEFFASLLGQRVSMNEASDVEDDNDVVPQDGIKLFG